MKKIYKKIIPFIFIFILYKFVYIKNTNKKIEIENVKSEYSSYALIIDKNRKTKVKNILVYPENYPSEFSGRVFISNIKFNIFWSLLDDNNNVKGNDIRDEAEIQTIDEKYVYDTTWEKHKIEPYSKFETKVIDLDDKKYRMRYIITNDGNNKLTHNFYFPDIKDYRQYIIITTDIKLGNVYPMDENMDEIKITYEKGEYLNLPDTP